MLVLQAHFFSSKISSLFTLQEQIKLRSPYALLILENEDKREVMRKEARNEAEKWDWNQATLQLQNYYSDTLKEID